MRHLSFRTKVAILSLLVSCFCIAVFSFGLMSWLYEELVKREANVAQEIIDELSLSLNDNPDYFSSEIAQERMAALSKDNEHIIWFNIVDAQTEKVCYRSSDWEPWLFPSRNGVYFLSRLFTFDEFPIYYQSWTRAGVRFDLQILLWGLKEELYELFWGFLFALPFAGLVAAAGGWWIARAVIRPIATLSAAAEEINTRALTTRVTVENPHDELGKLSQAFNQMVERLETGFQQAFRFSADASHELKTPLAIVRVMIEDALHRTRDPIEDQQVLNDISSEISRLTHIVESLLLLSRADVGQLQSSHDPVNISEILSALFEDVEIEAARHNIDVRLDLATCDLYTQGDRVLLTRVFENLVGNAIKYNHSGGRISITLKQDGDFLEVLISNSGSPIPREDQGRIFRRFYRGDTSHSRNIDGVGLGLSLCKEIIHVHEGHISLLQSDSDETVFLVGLKVFTRALT